jgi:hypothetical protein
MQWQFYKKDRTIFEFKQIIKIRIFIGLRTAGAKLKNSGGSLARSQRGIGECGSFDLKRTTRIRSEGRGGAAGWRGRKMRQCSH